jgi:hypothetical protein
MIIKCISARDVFTAICKRPLHQPKKNLKHFCWFSVVSFVVVQSFAALQSPAQPLCCTVENKIQMATFKTNPSAFASGDEVEYTDGLGKKTSVIILKIHNEDGDDQPYYTVVMSDGTERNTVRSHLDRKTTNARKDSYLNQTDATGIETSDDSDWTGRHVIKNPSPQHNNFGSLQGESVAAMHQRDYLNYGRTTKSDMSHGGGFASAPSGGGGGFAPRSDSGVGFAPRSGSGVGFAPRSGSGVGFAPRSGSGVGFAPRSGSGVGFARRSDSSVGFGASDGHGFSNRNLGYTDSGILDSKIPSVPLIPRSRPISALERRRWEQSA